MRFGAFVPQGWKRELDHVPPERQWETALDAVRRAERLGYDSLWVYDHFHTIPEPSRQSTLECWAVTAAVSQVTERIRIGQMVTCNSYRNPAYLAKVASTVDFMSGGRLDFGIGAGWYEQEYLAYGYEFPKASVRIAQLEEGVQIVKALFTKDEVHFEGDHYRVRGAINRPRPVQSPHPPIWIGGGGEQLTLRVVARHADYANFGMGEPEPFRHKAGILAKHCEEVGRDPSEITLSTGFNQFLIAADEKELERKLETFTAPGPWTPEIIRTRGFAGTVDQTIERLKELEAAGCSYLLPFFVDIAGGDGLELFAEEVMPHFR